MSDIKEKTTGGSFLDLDYSKYDFKNPETYKYKIDKGLNKKTIEEISEIKGEPEWMREFRLHSLEVFEKKPMPTWGGDLSKINFDEYIYYLRSSDKSEKNWDDVPEDIRKTFDKLGIPEAERKFLAGVGAQYESEVVYHSIRKDLEEKGVIFVDTDTALKEHPEIFKEHFGTVVPPEDNKFAALNSSVWSGGSFIYVPKGVRVDIPLQAYFRINAKNMGQFERTLIIADEGAFVHYLEGCLPPGELVSKGHTFVNIESVKPSEQIITERGEFSNVRATMTRPYKGTMITIVPQSKGNSFDLTVEHPVLCIKREKVATKRKIRKADWLPEVSTESLLNAQAEYVRAEDIKVGDFIVYVTPTETSDNETLTEDILKILGLYLAEGSITFNKAINKNVLSFSFGKSEAEKQLALELKSLIEKIGEKVYLYTTKKGGYHTVLTYSKKLIELCYEHCGKGASEKILSETIMKLPPQKQKILLDYYLKGDGNFYVKKPYISKMVRVSTASRLLAYQIQEIIARLGIFANISIRKGGDDVIQGRKITRKDQYIVEFTEDKKFGEARKKDNTFLIPVKKINKRDYDGFVFNLDVQSPNSYLVKGFAVHNCTAPIYSTDSLHSAVVELIAKKGARIRYTTIQNWSHNVYNLVTKRAVAHEDSLVEWIDGNLGCLTGDTMIYKDNNIVPISEINVGDYVWSLASDFKIVKSKVVGKKVNPVRPVYKMTLENERRIRATENHPFLVLRKISRLYTLKWLPLSEIKKDDLIATSGQIPDYIKSNKKVNEESVYFSKVYDIKEDGKEITYDIEVEGTANFIANGIFAHNSKLTMKYPSVYMVGRGARAEILSIAYAGRGQHQDAGAKVIHAAPYTTSNIISKSVSKDSGRTSYRGLVKVAKGAVGVKSTIRCDALMLDETSRSDTYPYMEIEEERVTIAHEATVGKINDDMLFYLMSRGLSEADAMAMVVNGFFEQFSKELPMDYALELNRLIKLQMEGAIG